MQEDVIVILTLAVLALSGSLEVFGSLEKPGNSRGEEVQEYTIILSVGHFRIYLSRLSQGKSQCPSIHIKMIFHSHAD